MYNDTNGVSTKVQIRCPAVKNGFVCNTRIADISLTGEATVFIRCPKCKEYSTIKVVKPPRAD